MKVLFVVSGEGYWGEEFIVPLGKVRESGFEAEVATPTGGKPVIDARSTEAENVGAKIAEKVKNMHVNDPDINDPISLVEAEKKKDDYAAVVFPGGHGALWDINQDFHAREILKHQFGTGKALVICHAVGILGFAWDGRKHIVAGHDVTGFPNEWENSQVNKDEVRDERKLPYRVENEVRKAGGNWDAELDKVSSVKVDGNLITARGPDSSEEAAEKLMEELGG